MLVLLLKELSESHYIREKWFATGLKFMHPTVVPPKQFFSPTVLLVVRKIRVQHS